MPSSRAMARTESPAAPSVTRWRLPIAMISRSIRSRDSCRLPIARVWHRTRAVLSNPDFPKETAMTTRYDEPNLAARTFNEVFRWLAEAGIGIAGTRALRVRGRKTGKRRGVVINLLTIDGRDYLVSPRGNTQWARNARAAGEVEMGPRWRGREVRITELADDAKPELLRRYVKRWYWEVKGHVGGLTPDSTDAELRAAAPSIPVFELSR